MNDQSDDNEQRRAAFEALNAETDVHAVAFRNYWRKEGEPWNEAVKLIRSVVTGETAVTDGVIENCRLAVMRLNQIRYVLGQLMLPVGDPTPGVSNAVMTIIRRIEDDTSAAVKNLHTILSWHAAARPGKIFP